MIKNDLHVHSIHSACGIHTIWELVAIASSKGMRLLNLSDHGKASRKNANFSVITDKRRIPNPVTVPGGGSMIITRGMEANILDEYGNTDITEQCRKSMDLISLGFHSFGRLLEGGSDSVNTEALVNAAARNSFDILTHPSIKTFPLHIPTAVDLACEFGFALELNNTHIRMDKCNVKKDEEILKLCAEKGALLVENSDGHTYHEIGENEKIEELVQRLGMDGRSLFMNRDDGKLDRFIEARRNLRNRN